MWCDHSNQSSHQKCDWSLATLLSSFEMSYTTGFTENGVFSCNAVKRLVNGVTHMTNEQPTRPRRGYGREKRGNDFFFL